MTTVIQVAIDEQNPWPGLGSFDEGAERFFNGRRNESAELRRLVLNAPLTVLFGASGLGKTSLLQAGLSPLLRREHWLPVYLRLDFRDRTAPLIDQVKFALQAQFRARGIDAPPAPDDESVWSYLHRTELELWSEQNQLLTPVFVLDQFEEVFTMGAQNPDAIMRLRIDLADLIENRVPAVLAEGARGNEAAGEALSLDSQRYKVVLSFREDFLPAVEGWKRELPSLLRNRLRLLPMSGEQAFEAVHTTASRLVDEALARQIVRFVAAAQENVPGEATEAPDSASELSVEPALLSLVCHGLNEKRKARNQPAFHETLLQGTGQSIISDYYHAAVGDLSERAQRFIRNELITERGFRKPCDIDDARTVHGVTDQELRLLVDRRVLRIEPQRATQRVELTHDLLTRAVREHRDRERERARIRRQRTRGAVVTVVGAALAGLVVVFGWLYLDGRRQRLLAELQARISTARQLAAEAETAVDQRPGSLPLAALLAVESLERHPTLEADQFLRHALPLLPRAVGVPMKHRGAVQAVTFSPDGTHLATASEDGTAAVWETATGRRVFAVVPGQLNDRISGVAFSPNGALLATASSSSANLWDAGNGVPFGPAKQRGSMDGVAFSPDGSYLATVGHTGAEVWDVNANPKVVFSLITSVTDPTFPCAPLSSFVFGPGGKHAAAACRGAVSIWQIGTWKRVVTIPYRPRTGLIPPLHPIAFSSDDKYLINADELHDVATGGLVHALHSQATVSRVVFSRDGSYVALATENTVRVVDTSDGSTLAELHHAATVRAIALNPSGDEIATAGDDSTARIWQVNRHPDEGPTQEITRVSHGDKVLSVNFSPDGKHLATASADGTAGLWQVVPVREVGQESTVGTNVSVVGVSSSGRFLAVAGAASVRVLEAAGGREVGRVHTARSDTELAIDRVGCSPDGRYLWTTFHKIGRRGHREIQNVVRVWDTSRDEEVATIYHEEVPGTPVFSPDSKRLVSDDRTTLQIWDVTLGKELRRVHQESAFATPVFSGDGGYLAIIEPKVIRILEMDRIGDIRSLPVGEETFKVVAFSPDEQYIAIGSKEAVDIRETKSGRMVNKLGVKYANAIMFSPDGKHIVTANWNFYAPSDKGVRIWNIVEQEQHEVGRLDFVEEQPAAVSDARLAWSKDGRYVAVYNQETVRLWDMSTHQEMERWKIPFHAKYLVFSIDGNYLLTANSATVSVWRWGVEAMIAEACSRLSRNLTPEEWSQYLGDEPYRKTCRNL